MPVGSVRSQNLDLWKINWDPQWAKTGWIICLWCPLSVMFSKNWNLPASSKTSQLGKQGKEPCEGKLITNSSVYLKIIMVLLGNHHSFWCMNSFTKQSLKKLCSPPKPFHLRYYIYLIFHSNIPLILWCSDFAKHQNNSSTWVKTDFCKKYEEIFLFRLSLLLDKWSFMKQKCKFVYMRRIRHLLWRNFQICERSPRTHAHL